MTPGAGLRELALPLMTQPNRDAQPNARLAADAALRERFGLNQPDSGSQIQSEQRLKRSSLAFACVVPSSTANCFAWWLQVGSHPIRPQMKKGEPPLPVPTCICSEIPIMTRLANRFCDYGNNRHRIASATAWAAVRVLSFPCAFFMWVRTVSALRPRARAVCGIL